MAMDRDEEECLIIIIAIQTRTLHHKHGVNDLHSFALNYKIICMSQHDLALFLPFSTRNQKVHCDGIFSTIGLYS